MELYDRLSRARENQARARKMLSDNELFLKSLADMPVTRQRVVAAIDRQRKLVAEADSIVSELEKLSGALPLKGGGK